MSPLKSHRRRSRSETDGTGNGSRAEGSGNELSGPALLEACLLGRVGFVESLLKMGASVHIRTDEGDTPLILAAVQGSDAAVHRLIDAGADLDAHNGHGLTALMEAAFWGNLDVARTLIQRGADVRVTDSKGRTALYWAVHEGRQAIVDLLEAVQNGGDEDNCNGSKPTVSVPGGDAQEPEPRGNSHRGCSGNSLTPATSQNSETAPR